MPAVDAYLENQVLTATPQKLRLLLIGGAIRFAHAAIQHWEQGRNDEAMEAIIRCRGIVTELFSVVRPEGFEPATQAVSLYVFLFRELTEAQATRDALRVRDVIDVLEEERETWRQLCEQLPESLSVGRAFEPREITQSSIPAANPGPIVRFDNVPQASSFSLDG
jgi:flagellar protein FliS